MSKKQLAIFISILLGIILAFFITRESSSPSKEPKENSIEADAEAILEQALDQFKNQSIHGTKTVYQSYYSDGTNEEETELLVYDSTQNALRAFYEYANNETYDNILVPEDDLVYSYIKDSSVNDEWIRYPEISVNDTETSYDYLLRELGFSVTEENGYSEIHLSKEGEEELSGTLCKKLKLTAKLEAINDVDEEEGFFTKITREDIIEENDWSEESVQAVDGFSELLDEYVRYLNEPTPAPEAMEESYTIWIDSSTSDIIQIEGEVITNYSEDISSDVEIEFWNRCWEVSWIQSDLDSGISLEDCLLNLEFDREFIEAQMKEDMIEETAEEDEKELSLTRMTFTKQFLFGDSCPSITLPSDYTETSMEDYYSEYPEEDM